MAAWTPRAPDSTCLDRVGARVFVVACVKTIVCVCTVGRAACAHIDHDEAPERTHVAVDFPCGGARFFTLAGPRIARVRETNARARARASTYTRAHRAIELIKRGDVHAKRARAHVRRNGCVTCNDRGSGCGWWTRSRRPIDIGRYWDRLDC